MGDRLATLDMGRKFWGCAPFGIEELGPRVTQCGLDRGLPSYQVASWPIQPFGHNRHGPKLGVELVRICTMLPGLRPTIVPS